ncbi:uncharacterized protein TNCV_2657851 [Trichonephila clavipes]|nr:uncharacterized protein TNCV_2657851 [Trichonephila clavipes]
MIVQFRNEKVSNHGSIPITIDCNVVAFIVFEEGFHQPIKRTKQRLSGFQMLNDGEIETSVYAESDPVDDETYEDEDNNIVSSKGPSNAGAFPALEIAMKWYEQQSDCYPT